MTEFLDQFFVRRVIWAKSLSPGVVFPESRPKIKLGLDATSLPLDPDIFVQDLRV